jgi:hypothetical protein
VRARLGDVTPEELLHLVNYIYRLLQRTISSMDATAFTAEWYNTLLHIGVYTVNPFRRTEIHILMIFVDYRLHL